MKKPLKPKPPCKPELSVKILVFINISSAETPIPRDEPPSKIILFFQKFPVLSDKKNLYPIKYDLLLIGKEVLDNKNQ